MTEHDFRSVYRELIEENPLAVRAVLKILEVTFTRAVPTLAVTCDSRPRLLVNLDFVTEQCRTEDEVKGLVCHEFLHVLLRHTDRLEASTPEEHLAFDAVINAIIHRTLGPAASSLMSRYYGEAEGPYRLVRPPAAVVAGDRHACMWKWFEADDPVEKAWYGLYDGHLVADDIRDLARDLGVRGTCTRVRWLGNHGDAPPWDAGADEEDEARARAMEELRQALGRALRSMDGSGIFRRPRERSLGVPAYTSIVRAADTGVERWRRETCEVLKRHLAPDPKAAVRESAPRDFVLPVLSPGDRRAALRSLWSPFLPDAWWTTAVPRRGGSAQVYLDVSGSMDAEMPLIVALLGRLARYIRRPFWAFSDAVAPARIEGGRLQADTTGGTSMTCVLEHIARTRPPAAVVVTDGYIEPLEARDVALAAAQTRIHVLVTRDGSPEQLRKAGLPYTQLSRLPQ